MNFLNLRQKLPAIFRSVLLIIRGQLMVIYVEIKH